MCELVWPFVRPIAFLVDPSSCWRTVGYAFLPAVVIAVIVLAYLAIRHVGR